VKSIRKLLVASLIFTAHIAANAQTPSSEPATADTAVVVSQGPAEITFTDIDARVSRVPVDKRGGFMNDPERIETLLRTLLLTRQMAAAAEAEGLDKDPVVLADIELAREEILARRRLALFVAGIKIPKFTELARERYVSSPTLYTTPESIDVRHILISLAKHGDEEANAIAQKLRSEIVASKDADFDQFARKHSEDAKASEDGGLIDDLVRGATLADFENAAFGLEKPGQISEIVKTKFGYHIIQLVSRTPAKRFPFEDARVQIENELAKEYLSRASQEFIDKMRNEALNADADRVQSLRTRYLPDGAGTKAIKRTEGEGHAALFAAPEVAPENPEG
jgi:parvulin-like peptidyl-prolyl isomerase